MKCSIVFPSFSLLNVKLVDYFLFKKLIVIWIVNAVISVKVVELLRKFMNKLNFPFVSLKKKRTKEEKL
jgi:hypothetical protein